MKTNIAHANTAKARSATYRLVIDGKALPEGPQAIGIFIRQDTLLTAARALNNASTIQLVRGHNRSTEINLSELVYCQDNATGIATLHFGNYKSLGNIFTNVAQDFSNLLSSNLSLISDFKDGIKAQHVKYDTSLDEKAVQQRIDSRTDGANGPRAEKMIGFNTAAAARIPGAPIVNEKGHILSIVLDFMDKSGEERLFRIASEKHQSFGPSPYNFNKAIQTLLNTNAARP